MKKVISCFLSDGHYVADACIVGCFDDRFTPALREFASARGLERFDLVRVAGGAKCLASPANESEREFLLKQIETSLRLHNAKRVVLMNHCDCGAYGGKKAFGDAVKEMAAHQAELASAKAVLESRLALQVPIDLCFVDFETIWEA